MLYLLIKNIVTADGRSVKSTYRFEGSNKLVNEQKNIKTDKIECTCTREFDNETGKLIEVTLMFIIN